MCMIAIANLTDGKTTIGFRIMNIDTKQVKDVTYDSVYNALATGKAKVMNLEIDNGILVGSNGSIDRLPKIVGGRLVGKSPIIIVNQIDNVGYTVVDYKGEMRQMTVEEVIYYANKWGIANGKLVFNNGKVYVSSIKGEYPKVYTDNQINLEVEIEKLNNKLRLLNEPYIVTENRGIKLLKKDFKSIALVDIITVIDDRTFENCKQLEKIKLPNNLKIIGKRAFSGCENLNDVVLPYGIESIGQEAFNYCKGLSNITIPDSVKAIGECAFAYSGIEEFKMPSNIEVFESKVFMDCGSLKYVDMGDELTILPSSTFVMCTELVRVKLPSKLITIEPSAFYCCYSLEHIQLPSTLTTIGSKAFSNCLRLNNVFIPPSVKALGNDVFYGCKSLKNIEVPRHLFFMQAISSLRVKAKTYKY